MASIPLPMPRFTIDEFLKMEREAEFRSEYIQGEIVAMSGGIPTHAILGTTVCSHLEQQLRDKPCTVAGSDLRLCCLPVDVLTYPDVVVFCEPIRYLDGTDDTLSDAVLIVEVLSKSTRNYDRGEKFRFYRTLPSFSEYLLLAQDEIRAEHHARQSDGSWIFREWTAKESVIHLNSIGCKLVLGDLYLKTPLGRPPQQAETETALQ